MVNSAIRNNFIKLKLCYCSLCVVPFSLEKENISFRVLCIKPKTPKLVQLEFRIHNSDLSYGSTAYEKVRI